MKYFIIKGIARTPGLNYSIIAKISSESIPTDAVQMEKLRSKTTPHATIIDIVLEEVSKEEFAYMRL